MKILIYDASQRKQPKSGYGLMSYQLGANLKSLGNEVVYYDENINFNPDVWLFIRPVHYVKYPQFKKENKNIFYTMHETETFEGWKSDWPQLLNKCDLVVTPTQWNKEVFVKNGVTVPIEVVPLGVNSKDFTGEKTYQFSILTLHDALGSGGSRENWKDTIKAYFDAFYNNYYTEVILTIKSYNIKREEYLHYINSLKINKEFDKFPMINIVDIDIVDLNSLYSKHWMFVKNANREGFSLPLIEAMSCGLTVAHTNLPVFEWTEGYKNKKVFNVGDVEKLKNIFLDEFKHWKKQKGFINSYSWKESARKLNDAIKKA